MITAKNLRKAGFVVGEKRHAHGTNYWWRDWTLGVREGIFISVCEDSGGFSTPELSIRRDYTSLNLTTVTELITLAKLLK